MKSEIINLIGNKKMTFDEIAIYFDISEAELKSELDSLVSNKTLVFENNKYSINRNVLSKDILLNYLKVSSYDTIFHLAKHFKVKEEIVFELLNNLINDGIIHKTNNKNNKNYYYLYDGEIGVKGGNLVIIDNETKAYYLVDDKLLFNGDLVKYIRIENRPIVISITKRKYEKLLGFIRIKNKINKKTNIKEEKISFHSYYKDIDVILPLSKNILNGAVNDDVVILDIEYKNNDIKPVKVDKIITRTSDNYLEVITKIFEYGFEIEFPKEVLDYTKDIPSSVSLDEMDGRIDYRNKDIITIDNDDSKDFDDAVSLEILSNGNYKLGVYIADVANYVKEKSPLDKEALRRGTSLYLGDMVVPMLPFSLSNGICSLNPNENRLVLACIMEINKNGEVVNYDINEGVIKSKYQMTYSKVNKILAKDEALINEYHDIYDMLINMETLSKIIRKRRENKGAIDFDTTEFSFKIENGIPKEIVKCERGIAEKLIEDFMLIANETVAYHASITSTPIVYRIHEKPDQDRINETLNEIFSMGYKVKKMKNGVHSKELQKLLVSLHDDPNYEIISDMILRSMMKAKYSENNLGHYGLQLENYCHFTSPIRRYPDLMTHRVIKELLLHPNNYKEDYKRLSANIPVIAFKTSSSEKRSTDLERKVDDIYYAKYYENKIGLSVVGKIKTIANFGMFIRLDNGLEGLLPFYNMPEYMYVNLEHTIAESENGLKYKLGDTIKVVISDINKKEGLVEFEVGKRRVKYYEDYM